MRIAIIQFPGSNCERETILAVKRAGMQPSEFLWNDSKAKLMDFAGFIIVGGFSYEDRIRAGKIAALDPLIDALHDQSALGKPILGICNGAQILVEAVLVPGLEHNAIGMALTDNQRMQGERLLGTGYYNAWVNMRLSDEYQRNAFFFFLTQKNILSLPVAHAEGRFVVPEALLKEMVLNGQHVFQYCDDKGVINAEFPVNPNGSIHNIAAVSNKRGNVLAMMPHPERTTQGGPIFTSMRDYIANGFHQKVAPLHYLPRPAAREPYQPALNYELITELLINDNQVASLENVLHQKEIHAKVRRFIHWEIACDSHAFEHIKASGVLYHPRKERIVSRTDVKKLNGKNFLIRAKNDVVGLHANQLLKHHFSIEGLHAIQHGILWNIQSDLLADSIINAHILSNPYSHDDYDY